MTLGPIAFLNPLLLAGALAVEVVFAWPGMGRLAYDALSQRDYPLVLGWTCCNAVLVLLGGLLADSLHAALDPRVRGTRPDRQAVVRD
jgi:peptide/nickel transport system permease protein